MLNLTFPLQGDWGVAISPADHVPSHYTEKLGMSYAFDFAKINDMKTPLLSRLVGVPINKYQGWGEKVFSPCNGKVIETYNASTDRRYANAFVDFTSASKALFFNTKREDYNTVFGNYIIIRSNGYYCLLAHLQKKSIQVSVGDSVSSGDFLANIGHCGSSQLPHLHFQVMDNEKLSKAKGLPVSFDLSVNINLDEWHVVEKCVPAKGLKIKGICQPI